MSELSAESGMELKRLHHHVGRLCRLGLVAVVATRPRAGRAIKLYAAAHSEFFVPHGLAAEPTTDGLARELRAALAEEADRSGTGVLFSTGPNGEPLAEIVRHREAGEPPLELWRLLRLSRAEARAMSDALREVVDRHCALSSGRGKPYLFHTALIRRRAATFSVDNASHG